MKKYGALICGYSKHMTRKKTLLKELKKVDEPMIIFERNEKPTKTKGVGSIKRNGLEIKEISYVKGLKFNLLSTSQFYDKGYTIEFNHNGCKVISIESGKVVFVEFIEIQHM